MKFPSQEIIEAINSEDVHDFELAINILSNQGMGPEELEAFLNKYLDRTRFYYKSNSYDFSVSRHKISSGIYDQMLWSGYKHSYSINSFSLDTLKESIESFYKSR